MPTIYDNIEKKLSEGLYNHIEKAERVDYCVGYFNLRGWKIIADKIDDLTGMAVTEGEHQFSRYCRLLVGMIKTPKESLIDSFLDQDDLLPDNAKVTRIKNKLAQEFKDQLTIGVPTEQDEKTLQKLLFQLKDGKVVVKLFLRYQLHAKLYLAHGSDRITPKLGLLGSSNLTFPGISGQGELNVDVIEQDAVLKLDKWFNDRWNDRWCIDITKELIEVLQTSWAREDKIKPYHVYLKMAYHLSHEARSGISEFKLPRVFQNELLDFQQKAVLIAAQHLNKRGGVMVGDVVGLGKTITATAIAKLLEEDLFYETLIICPKNLVSMWEIYVYTYQLHAKVISQSVVERDLPNLRRYRLIIIDESHNLRNSEGRRYKAIKSYIEENESKVILLSATPYNKSYVDLSNQLRLFVADDTDLGITPEAYIKQLGGTIQFQVKHTDTFIRSIKAFEKSDYADDWRELMKLYLIRRTRSFIRDNYASTNETNGRKYLTFADGRKSYFPDRLPKKVEFKLDEKDKKDQYALLYSEYVVSTIDELMLPRYGLGNYINEKPTDNPNHEEEDIIRNLSRAGQRLKGFCRTNLFKRLESTGYSFLLSLSRHLLRNFIFVYALERDLPIPIGKQYMDFFDEFLEDQDDDERESVKTKEFTDDEGVYLETAHKYYNIYFKEKHDRFKWIRASQFKKDLKKALADDCKKILTIFDKVENWDSVEDRKLNALYNLLVIQHPQEKVLIFTQFADTAEYLSEQLSARGIKNLALVTGDSDNVTDAVQHFSPESNQKPECIGCNELRILITTDVLSEGQNLQDAHIVLNYDLPWAIIRLIQRAGRVDRLGQKATEILCYSFLPEDGIEHIIKLRTRLTSRIKQNSEVVGSDEVFFEGDPINLEDIYNEKSGILDDDDESEVDLASYAYQIWKNATDNDERLKKIIPEMSNVVYSTKPTYEINPQAEGVIVYAKTSEDNDVLTWLDKTGNVITQSQYTILRAAQCTPDTPALDKIENHHELVKKGIDVIVKDETVTGGTLGRKNGVKYRVYMRLSRFYDENKGTLYVNENIKKALDDIYRFPLKESAIDVLSRQMKSGISDNVLSDLIISLKEEDKLCIVNEDEVQHKLPQIICSLGIANGEGVTTK
jgi:superfamily II DNA or RNA helicase